MEKACLTAAKSNAAWFAETLAFIGKIPEETIDLGRGVKEPRWYRRMTHINLPDAHVGCAVLDLDEVSSKLQTFGYLPEADGKCRPVSC